MWDSIAMAWLGTLIAAVVAVPLGFLAAENLVPRWFSFLRPPGVQRPAAPSPS